MRAGISVLVARAAETERPRRRRARRQRGLSCVVNAAAQPLWGETGPRFLPALAYVECKPWKTEGAVLISVADPRRHGAISEAAIGVGHLPHSREGQVSRQGRSGERRRGDRDRAAHVRGSQQQAEEALERGACAVRPSRKATLRSNTRRVRWMRTSQANSPAARRGSKQRGHLSSLSNSLIERDSDRHLQSGGS